MSHTYNFRNTKKINKYKQKTVQVVYFHESALFRFLHRHYAIKNGIFFRSETSQNKKKFRLSKLQFAFIIETAVPTVISIGLK